MQSACASMRAKIEWSDGESAQLLGLAYWRAAAHTSPLVDVALRTMIHVNPEEIVEFVRSQGELHLSTLAQKRPFVVRVSDDTLEFIPSSDKPRSRDRESLARVCEEFDRTNSWHPGDYADLSVHASYTLAVMDAYLKSK